MTAEAVAQPSLATESTFSDVGVLGSTALAMLISFVPVAFVIHREWLIALIAGGIVVGILIELRTEPYRGIRRTATGKPSSTEFALAGISSFQLCSFAAVTAIGFYYAVAGIVHAINSVFDLSWSAYNVAFVTMLVIGALPTLVFFCAEADDSAKALYPETAGISSGFYELSRSRRRRNWVFGTVAAFCVLELLALVLPVAMGTMIAVTVVFLLALFVISSLIAPTKHESVKDQPEAAILAAVATAFQRMDYGPSYQPITFPRTGRPEIDPFMLDVDLLVYTREGEALAIDLKVGPRSTPVDWTTCAGLLTASRAAVTVMDAGARLHPVVILVDCSADESFQAFSTNEGVSAIEVDRQARTVRITSRPEDAPDLHAYCDQLRQQLLPDTQSDQHVVPHQLGVQPT